MIENKKNYSMVNIGPLESLIEKKFLGFPGKYFVGEELGLTGCECSLNRLPAGVGMPFIHTHKHNEELFIIIRGSGTFYIDGEEFPVQEGSVIKISPSAKRAWKAGDEDMYMICVQAEENSLQQATLKDGIKIPEKASWMRDAKPFEFNIQNPDGEK